MVDSQPVENDRLLLFKTCGYSNIRHLVSLWHCKRPFASARGGRRARENELFFPITKGQLMSFSVSPQMDLFPTKLNSSPDRVHHHHYWFFRSIDTGGTWICTWKKIAKGIIIIRILFFERAQFSLGA